MKRNIITILISAVLVVVFALLLFVFQVRKSEIAVVTTFGKPGAQPITEPGAYFKWPWPIQKVYKFDNRVQNFHDIFSETYTADSVTLLSSVYVGWRISDGQRFLLTIRNGSIADAESKLESMVRSAKIDVIGKHQLSEFVNADPKQLKFEEIENEIEQKVQSQLSTNNYGINLDFLGFEKIGLPEGVTQSVFDRMKSERQSLIVQNQSLGDSEALKIKSGAEREAAETIARANATAIKIRAAGESEAANTYKVFQQNPALANFLLRVDALKAFDSKQTTLIFDERFPPFDLFTSLPTNSIAK